MSSLAGEFTILGDLDGSIVVDHEDDGCCRKALRRITLLLGAKEHHAVE